MPTRFEDAYRPLIRIHAFGTSTDADILERITFTQRQLYRREKIGLVFDTTGGSPLTARQRRMWSNYLTENSDLIRRYLVGCAMVVESPIMRGVFTSIFWIWPPPTSFVFFGTSREATAWVLQRLKDAGLTCNAQMDLM